MDREKLKVNDSVGQSTSPSVSSNITSNITAIESSSKSHVISLDESRTVKFTADGNGVKT